MGYGSPTRVWIVGCVCPCWTWIKRPSLHFRCCETHLISGGQPKLHYMEQHLSNWNFSWHFFSAMLLETKVWGWEPNWLFYFQKCTHDWGIWTIWCTFCPDSKFIIQNLMYDRNQKISLFFYPFPLLMHKQPLSCSWLQFFVPCFIWSPL